MEAILFSFFTFLSTLAGGLFGLRQREQLHYIESFTVGVLLGVCFFDIVPEAFRITTSLGIGPTPMLVALVTGFIVFHVLEKAIVIHHSHEGQYAEHKHPSVGLFGAFGLAFHSFLDGVGIGVGFHVSPAVGLLIAIAVIAHDFSDGLNTVALMLSHKNTIRKTFFLLLLDAAAPMAGVESTYVLHFPESWLVLYLGFFAGFLLYIGASDLLPEAHSKHSSWLMLGLTVLGATFIFLVTRIA
ncbi:MAG: ZIP family metal transporter [Candidatus Korobacteraceae bacterium]